ncbi:glutamine amidotransferase [Methylocystis heyeri]|uniref:Glutamine amidotransferase n=1 Tax=Methylocystis heyeri TaxID=391905 RepID=A0A6B8K8D8_9HYPH|nr:glutamine amidotransferase [Methylocystis heyeri]QGM44266.1 glutamine amidotransferase [Methylocystis heyeri]
MRKTLAITHVAFEDLGTLGLELERAGAQIEFLDASTSDLRSVDPLDAELMVVLGGPIGVYEAEAYPFIEDEIGLLRTRLAARRPTLGICLGAQLIAAAAGARVFPGACGKELGWAPLTAGRDAERYPAFARLLADAPSFLHWHGDTFEAPEGSMHLAQTSRYPNQAFALEHYALGLQFHPEVTADSLERWYVGHACELANAKIDVVELRRQGRLWAPKLESAARLFWRSWIAQAFSS